MGDNLNNTLTRPLDLTGKSKASLDLSGWWDIEKDYDFLYTEVSTDNGASWNAIDGTADGKAITRDSSNKPALTDASGAYKKLSFPLDQYAGQKIQLRFRYQTDGGAGGKGFTADAITVTADGTAVVTDGAEGDDNGWTAKNFTRIGESFTNDYPQYYIAENRQYVSYDTDPQGRPVQLRLLDDPSELGRALPVPEGPAHLALGHLPEGQQRLGPPGPGPDPADRRARQAAQVGRRHAAPQQDPALRRAVQLVPDGLLHAAQGGRRDEDQLPDGRPDLRRPPRHVLVRREPDRKRQGS